MTGSKQDWLQIVLAAREAFSEEKNVTDFLKELLGKDHNTSDIIEIAYDMQAGSYIEGVQKNPAFADSFASELGEILSQYI